jgi:hypothetical protein
MKGLLYGVHDRNHQPIVTVSSNGDSGDGVVEEEYHDFNKPWNLLTFISL